MVNPTLTIAFALTLASLLPTPTSARQLTTAAESCTITPSPKDMYRLLTIANDPTCAASGIGCVSKTCRYCRLKRDDAYSNLLICSAIPGFITGDGATFDPFDVDDNGPAFNLQCSTIVSDGDARVGIDIATDVSCTLGGVGCLNDLCRYCKKWTTVQSASFIPCSDVDMNNGDDVYFTTIPVTVAADQSAGGVVVGSTDRPTLDVISISALTTTTPAPTTAIPAPTTAPPTTAPPTTAPPTTVPPTTRPPTAAPATTVPPTAPPPTIPAPTTAPPTTAPPATVPPATTVPPTTWPPTLAPPTTAPPTTAPPTTAPPTTAPPTTAPPATAPPATAPPATAPPSTAPPSTTPPATAPPSTAPPTTAPPTTPPATAVPPTTRPPTLAPSTTAPPTTAPPTTTPPTIAPPTTVPPVSVPAVDTCALTVSSGDNNVGISAFTDTACQFGGLGCFSTSCRFCKTFDSPQSSYLFACPRAPAPTTQAPTPTTQTPVPTTQTPAPTIATPVPTTTAPVTPTPTTRDACASAVSSGDNNVGINGFTDATCLFGGLGCFSTSCRFCKSFDSPQSSYLQPCASFTPAPTTQTPAPMTAAPAPTTTAPPPPPTTVTPTPTTVDPCAATVSSGDNAAGISAYSDSACRFGGLGCFSTSCRFCKMVGATQSQQFLPCPSRV